MKSTIFRTAIIRRCKVRFLYRLEEIILDPYYIAINQDGRKVIYGKSETYNKILKFDYDKITNIKILDFKKFTPIIPIIPNYN